MKVNRRQLLLSGLAAPWLAAERTVSAPLIERGFARVTKIADGVFATIADGAKGPQCLSNGGVIAGRDAMLIVEGHFQPAGAALEIEVARTIGKAPVRAAVDTHYHLDHSFGNLAYADQRIPIIAYEKAAGLMKERYLDLKGVDKAPLLAPLKQKIANAADATDKARKQVDLEKLQWMYAAIDSENIVLPTELLREAELPKRIDLGGLTAVIELHPGHTITDLVIRVPERDVVFTGDLLFHRSYPVTVDADMMAWRKVLDNFSRYGRRTQFVPGHGPVCELETVRDQAALMDELRAHAEKMIRSGATADEAERRYVPSKQFQSYRNGAWGWTVGPAMQSYYRSLKPRQSSTPAR